MGDMQPRLGRNGTFAEQRFGMVKTHRLIGGMLVISCLVLSAVWFLFISRFWSIQRIEVQGAQEISGGEVEAAAFSVMDQGSKRPWDQRNIFYVNSDQLANEVKNALFLESVTVDKVYPNVLRLLIVERQRKAVFGFSGQFFDVDPHGFVTGQESEATSGYYRDLLSSKTYADTYHAPLIYQPSTDVASSTSITTSTGQFVDAEVIKGWLDASKELLASGLRYRLLKVADVTSDTFRVVTDKGYDIVMNFNAPITTQADSYQRFIQTKPKSVQIQEYIDVRVPGKIFVK